MRQKPVLATARSGDEFKWCIRWKFGPKSTLASRSKIYIVRSQPNAVHTEVYQMDLSSIADFGLANQFKMRSNDIVYVDASGLAHWQRVVNRVIPFSNALYNLDRFGQ